MITVDYYFARSLLSSFGICAEVFRASFSFSCLLRFRSSFLLSLSLSLSLSFRERMKKKSSNVTFWIDVAFVNGCE
jgi:hypothetical protein